MGRGIPAPAHRQQHGARRVATVLALVALVAAGCGGDDGPRPAARPGPEDEIRRAVRAAIETTDADAVCTKLVTRRFVDDVYAADTGRCLEHPFNRDLDGRVRFGEVRVAGTRASAAIAFDGASAPGTAGTVELAREGTAWKLDRLGDDYLRTSLVSAMKATETGLISEPRMKACMIRQVEALDAPKLRRYVHQVIREDPARQPRTVALARGCPDELAANLADTLAERLAESGDRSDAFIECARRRFVEYLELTEMAQYALRGNSSDIKSALLEGLAEGVERQCERQG